jgi:hypothetical protein
MSAGGAEHAEECIAPRKSRVTLEQDEGDPAVESPALQGHASEGGHPVAPAGATECELKAAMARAKTAIDPSVKAALVIAEFGGHSDVAALAVQLQIGMNNVSKNDLRKCEAMLYSQAHALQAIFVGLARQAAFQVKEGGWFPNYEAHMRLALKAQSQCRTTLETLAQIKNPPVVFARQANIAQGPQQVNNEMPCAGAWETENAPDKLLEVKPHKRLDTGTPGAAVGSDPAMATVGTFDRAEVRRG